MDGQWLFFAFVISLGLAIIPASIAKSKGRDFESWYIYGVVLWLPAIIHAATLTPTEKVKESALKESGRVPCPQCAELIKAEAKICRFCGSPHDPASPNEPAKELLSDDVKIASDEQVVLQDSETVNTDKKGNRAFFIVGTALVLLAIVLVNLVILKKEAPVIHAMTPADTQARYENLKTDCLNRVSLKVSSSTELTAMQSDYGKAYQIVVEGLQTTTRSRFEAHCIYDSDNKFVTLEVFGFVK